MLPIPETPWKCRSSDARHVFRVDPECVPVHEEPVQEDPGPRTPGVPSVRGELPPAVLRVGVHHSTSQLHVRGGPTGQTRVPLLAVAGHPSGLEAPGGPLQSALHSTHLQCMCNHPFCAFHSNVATFTEVRFRLKNQFY